MDVVRDGTTLGDLAIGAALREGPPESPDPEAVAQWFERKAEAFAAVAERGRRRGDVSRAREATGYAEDAARAARRLRRSGARLAAG